MASEKFNQLKQHDKQDSERLKEQMTKDWLEYVRDRLKDIAKRFSIKMDEGKVRSRRIR